MREQIHCAAFIIASICLPAETSSAEPKKDKLSDQPVPTDKTAINPEILAVVPHPEYGLKTKGIREEEREAYFWILEKARQVDYKMQRATARDFMQKRMVESKWRKFRSDPEFEFPIFVDLLNNADKPEVYHGKLVTFKGHIRRLTPMFAGENDYDLKTLYESWIYTADSQQHPAVVICSSIPEGMLKAFQKKQLLDHVSATGYFFKMYAYEAQDQLRFAPLILAQRLQWRPPPLPAPSLIAPSIVYTGIFIGMVSVLIVLWFMAKKDRQIRIAHRQVAMDFGTELPDLAPSTEPDKNTGFTVPDIRSEPINFNVDVNSEPDSANKEAQNERTH